MLSVVEVDEEVFFSAGGARCLSLQQAARRLRISRQAVTLLAQKGRLRSRRVGQHTVVFESAVEAYRPNRKAQASGRARKRL